MINRYENLFPKQEPFTPLRLALFDSVECHEKRAKIRAAMTMMHCIIIFKKALFVDTRYTVVGAPIVRRIIITAIKTWWTLEYCIVFTNQ